jgi:hypothetical protein
MRQGPDLLDTDFFRVANLNGSDKTNRSIMDGLYNYGLQEPLFKEYLQKVDDEQLSHGTGLCVSVD